MCYQILLHVILQKDSLSNRASVVPPPELNGVFCRGQFPDFEVTSGWCACPLVLDKGARLKGVPAVLEYFLALTPVKRVDIIWFWAGDQPEEPQESKVQIQEFCGLNDAHNLRFGHRYRVSRPWRFERDQLS
jgi:hypothetical protein